MCYSSGDEARVRLEVNDAQFLIYRLSSFPQVGVAKAECQARSRISQVPY